MNVVRGSCGRCSERRCSAATTLLKRPADAALSQGIWAVLAVFLLIYIVKSNERFSARQEEREKQYQELLAMDGVKLKFEDDALKLIAEKAINRKSGARGLRSIIESAMQKVMFDVPDISDAKKVVVTADCIDGLADAAVYGTRNKKIA